MDRAKLANSSSSGSGNNNTLNGLVLRVLKARIASSEERSATSLPVLRRAYTSLEACPVLFSSLEELRQLDGFESQALLLEIARRVGDLYTERGLLVPAAYGCNALHGSTSTQMAGGRRACDRTPASKGPNTAASAKQKAATSTSVATPKQYVPQARTGTHGILVALFALTPDQPLQHDMPPDKRSCFAKALIIAHAQPFSEAKYVPKRAPTTFGSGHMSFHSAWSGMKTLINRGYVYRSGNPARFSLSATGWDVARICAGRESGITPGCRMGAILAAAVAGSDEEGNVDESGAEGNGPSEVRLADTQRTQTKSTSRHATVAKTQQAQPSVPVPFLYSYLSDGDPPRITNDRCDAATRLGDKDYCVQHRIVFEASLETHLFVAKCVEITSSFATSDKLLSGWIKGQSSNDRAPGVPPSMIDCAIADAEKVADSSARKKRNASSCEISNAKRSKGKSASHLARTRSKSNQPARCTSSQRASAQHAEEDWEFPSSDTDVAQRESPQRQPLLQRRRPLSTVLQATRAALENGTKSPMKSRKGVPHAHRKLSDDDAYEIVSSDVEITDVHMPSQLQARAVH